MSRYMRITGGRVYDPANGIDGEVRDVRIADGVVVDRFSDEVTAGQVRTIDATGMVVMPGGVDIHCHIASSSVNRARAMAGEEHATHVHHASCGRRGGSGIVTPSTFTTGYRYAALGYTTAIEAAVSPSGARQTHLELDDTPNLDAGFLLLVANHQRVIELLAADRDEEAIAFVAELLQRTGAFGIKVVNPGGVAAWRNDPTQHVVKTIDDRINTSSVTPRRIMLAMADAAERLRLPHAPHVHCNRLGVPGNVETTLDTLRAFEGRRVHLTHVQFHAYGRGEKGELTSGVQRLVSALNEQPNATADVGQVMFGDAFTLTGDTPLEYLLYQLAGKSTRPYVSIESELESGCGLMPIEYSDKQYLHSLQWAIGLELMLTSADPWRMLLSTDHPNGGSFLTYPAIIAALMSKAVRDEHVAKADARAMGATRLRDLSRELTLGEVAIITRAGPARTLGLRHKGHLGGGADGDVTGYAGDVSDPQRMFETPRYVIKAGRVLVEDGELRGAAPGGRFRAEVEQDEKGDSLLRDWFARHGSYDVAQLGVHEHERAAMRGVAGDASC